MFHLSKWVLTYIFVGSSVAIQAAQTTISGALDNLTKNISAAKELNTAALKNFKENIDMLFHVMGPNAADFVNQKVEIHRQLDEKYQKKRELMDELSKQRGELIVLLHLLQHFTFFQKSRIIYLTFLPSSIMSYTFFQFVFDRNVYF